MCKCWLEFNLKTENQFVLQIIFKAYLKSDNYHRSILTLKHPLNIFCFVFLCKQTKCQIFDDMTSIEDITKKIVLHTISFLCVHQFFFSCKVHSLFRIYFKPFFMFNKIITLGRFKIRRADSVFCCDGLPNLNRSLLVFCLSVTLKTQATIIT